MQWRRSVQSTGPIKVDIELLRAVELGPMIRLQLRARLVEFFLMKRAFAQAASRVESRSPVRVSQLNLARSLLGTASTLEQGPNWQLASVLLLREAALVAALAYTSNGETQPGAVSPSAVWVTVCESTETQTFLRSLSPLALERAEAAFCSGVSPECSEWTRDEVGQLLQSLKRITQQLVTWVERDAYAIQRLRAHVATRWAGTLGVASLLLGGVGFSIARIGTVNLALNASVTSSSTYLPEVYNPKKLVDGDKTAIGCHTLVDPSPWVVIDLGEEYLVRRVVVTNRHDVPAESAVPLVVELSTDGNTYTEFARQLDAFRSWTATGDSVKARFVRLVIPRTSVLHLNEVEVF